MTQDQRLATIKDRMRTSASNLRFATTLSEGRRLLNAREEAEFNALAVEVIRALGELCVALDIGEAPDETCP